MLSLKENLIKHGLSRKFSIVTMLILNKRYALVGVEMDIFNFSPRREVLIEYSDHVSNRSGRIGRELNVSDKESSAFFIERTNSRMIFLMSSMTSSSENISQIIFKCFFKIFVLGSPMIESTINSFSACTSCKINTEVCRTLLFKLISFRESSVNLWIAFV
jgi:hypothetical protein